MYQKHSSFCAAVLALSVIEPAAAQAGDSSASPAGGVFQRRIVQVHNALKKWKLNRSSGDVLALEHQLRNGGKRVLVKTAYANEPAVYYLDAKGRRTRTEYLPYDTRANRLKALVRLNMLFPNIAELKFQGRYPPQEPHWTDGMTLQQYMDTK